MASSHLVHLAVTYFQLKKKIRPHTVTPVSVHLSMEIPPGYYGRSLPRSGLACHYFINIGGGVIDSDFRGELIVIIFNHSNKLCEVGVGDRIAQIVFHRYETPNFVLCNEISKTYRGLGRFGSIGN